MRDASGFSLLNMQEEEEEEEELPLRQKGAWRVSLFHSER